MRSAVAVSQSSSSTVASVADVTVISALRQDIESKAAIRYSFKASDVDAYSELDGPDLESASVIATTKLIRELNFGVREGMPRSMSFPDCVHQVALRLGVLDDEVEDTTEASEDAIGRQEEFIKKHLYQLAVGSASSLVKEDAERRGNKEEDVHSLSSITGGGNSATTSAAVDHAAAVAPASSRNDPSDKDQQPLNVLCLSHGGFIRSFLRNFGGMQHTAPKIGNCALSVIDIEWSDMNDPDSFRCTVKPDRVNMDTSSGRVDAFLQLD